MGGAQSQGRPARALILALEGRTFRANKMNLRAGLLLTGRVHLVRPDVQYSPIKQLSTKGRYTRKK